MNILGDTLPRRLKAKASGAITAGKPLIVEADGDVAQVALNAAATGSATTFESGNTNNLGMCYDTANDKIVIAYKDESNSDYGTAIVIQPSANQRFIGFAQGSASDGGSVSVLTKGALDAKNSSLLVGGHYYVKPDGTVALKTGNTLTESHWPYVGKAVSATQIAIYNEG